MSPSIQITRNYAVSTLDETPRRVLEFLRGAGSSPQILRLLSAAGYTAVVHEEGQRLLANVIGFVQERQAFQPVTSATHLEAMTNLTAWHRGVFRRLRATLTRFHPEQAAALFANLEISAGVDVSIVAKIFLDRLEALEGDHAAKGSRRSSHAVVKMLADRGFGPHEIRSVRKLIEVADAPAQEAADPALVDNATKREVRLDLLRELRSWYDDWSETARSVLVRRDHAIRVGIAHRKARKVPANGQAPIALLPPSSTAA